MTDPIRTLIAEHAVEFVDLMYTDLVGGWHHLTLPASRFDDALVAKGVGVDGSSVVGFRATKAGDMVLVPDVESHFLHPFSEHPTLCILGNLVDVGAHEGFPRDPRFVAAKAERRLAEERPGERSLWLPELEFFLFDEVEMWGERGHSGYRLVSLAAAHPGGEPAVPTVARHCKRYHAAAPEDRFADVRSEMCRVLASLGIPVKYHHHEVGGSGQAEIELAFLPLCRAGDAVALAKWVIRLVAEQYGLVATFMPKPLFGEAGSGLHFHQYLVRDGMSVFFDASGPGPLSEVGRCYVGGLLHHGRALAAITNPSTNSYKRLVPGFEAPVRLAYSVANRTAAIRVPGYAKSGEDVRIEYRPPDATANAHLALAAMLMAGLDGIRRRLDPGPPLSGDVFALPPEALAAIPALPTSLDEALDALATDHEFLLEGNVFTEDLLAAWIALKRAEAKDVAERPHPREFELYFGA